MAPNTDEDLSCLDEDGEEISAPDLRDYLSGQVRHLNILRGFLLLLVVLVLLGVVAHVIYYYNYLTTLKFDALNAEAKVGSGLQFRANLVPQLVEVLSNFVDHEEYVFDQTIDGRERALSPKPAIADQLRQAARLPVEEALSKIMAIAEQYPELKTAEPFQTVMTKITEAESKVLELRIDYNDAVNIYTSTMEVFPGNFYSALFNFERLPYFKAGDGSEWPQISVRTNRTGANTTRGSQGRMKDEL